MMVDVAIIGAGIAGASIAAFLPKGLSVVLLEAEEQAGFHTTGRSAAFFTETYGGPEVQPLTTASKAWFFDHESTGLADPVVSQRGALHVDWGQSSAALERFADELRPLSPLIEVIDAAETLQRCPVLKQEGLAGGVWDEDCCDIDVARLHAHFLRISRQNGHKIVCDFRLADAELTRGVWQLTCEKGEKIFARRVVNAAGAWADSVARLFGVEPLGLEPKRRTIGLFHSETGAPPENIPLTLDLAEQFYFKPQSGQWLISPADETPSPPCDAQPEEEDVAVAAYRVEQATILKLNRCTARWAGLRTFAPDRIPVYGFDDAMPGFFWCAGQGGFGIQTAPAAGEFAAALLMDEELPERFQKLGITAQRYAPRRFSLAA